MAYSYKQRADKGFDFYDDKGQKVFIDDYVKNTGANKNQLVQKLAGAGDVVSRQAISKLPDQFRAQAKPKLDWQAQARISATQAQLKQAQADTWNPIKIIGDVSSAATGLAKGAGNIAVDTINSLGNRVADFGEAGANVVREFSGQNAEDARVNRESNKLNDTAGQSIMSAYQRTSDPVRKKQLQDAYARINSQQMDINSQYDTQVRRAINATDPLKTITNAAETALDVATAGKGAALLNGIKSVAEPITKQALKQLAVNTAKTTTQGAVTGGLYSGVNTARTPEATLQDYATNMAQGAALGAGVGIGAQVLLPVVGKMASNATKGASDAVTKGAQVLNESTPRYQAAQHPSVLGFDDQYKTLQRQFDTLPAGSQARRQVSVAMAANRSERLKTSQLIQRQISERGSVPAGNFDPTGKLGKETGKLRVPTDDEAKGIINILESPQGSNPDVIAATKKYAENVGFDYNKALARKNEFSMFDKNGNQKIKSETITSEKPKVTLQEGRANQVLDKKIRYNGKVMTRSEYIDALKSDGYTPIQNKVDGKTKYSMKSSKGDYYDISKIEYDKASSAPQVTKDLPIVGKQLGKETPKTVKIFTKSKFNPDSKGTYADYPVIRQDDNITLYQGSNPGEQRQYWTPNKKYAEQFGNVKEKTGSFYKIDNGNRMTDVYVEVPSKSTPAPQVTKTPKQPTAFEKNLEQAGIVPKRTEIAPKVEAPLDPTAALKQEALKYKTAEEFVEAKKFEKGSTVPIGDQVSFEKTLSPQDLAIHQRLKDIQHKMAALDPKNGYKPYKISQEDKAFYSKYSPEAGKKYQAYFAKADKAHQQLTDLYNQAHAQPAPKVEAPKPTVAPQVTKTLPVMPEDIASINRRVDNGELVSRQSYAKLNDWIDKSNAESRPIEQKALQPSEVLSSPQGIAQKKPQSRQLLSEKASTPASNSSIQIPKDGDSLSNIITQTLKLTKGQAKQRFRKLQRDGTPFEVVNDLDKNVKKKGTNIVSDDGVITQGGSAPLPDINLNQFRDRSALGLGRETMERNLDRVAGKDAPALKKYLVDASRKNETDRTLFVNNERAAVKQNIVKKLGIKANSNDSALVQKYGEKLIDAGDLIREVGEVRASRIIEASNFYRSRYDDMIDRWNAVRQQYGYEAIPKRPDYFRHFQAIENANSILGTIKNAKDLPTGISGITDIFNPSKPFSDAALARKGNKTTFDAVSGFDNYLDSISRQVYHTDTVQRGRALEKAIRGSADAETLKVELPNFVANLGEWTNLVSGKKARIDRAAEAMFGRKVFAGANAIKRRVGANMIGANLASAATSFIPMTQALATTNKLSAVRGIVNTLSTVWTSPAAKIDGVTSGFLTRRFPTQAMSRTVTEKIVNGSYLPMRALDGFNSRAIVSSKYFENVKKGMSKTNAMKAADDYAGKVITDRSLGQQANLFEAKTPGFFTQFMAEVNNQASFVIRDVPAMYKGNPVAVTSALVQMTVYAYLFNEAFEAMTGRRVAVDPIDFVQTMADPEKTDEQKWEAFQQDILSAIPGSGFVFDSGRLPINAAMPDFESLMSSGKSFAEGKTEQAVNQFVKGVSGPVAFLAPPTGGGQAKKMLDAWFNQAKGYSATPSGEIRFLAPTEPLDIAKSFVFGQYSTDKGKEYIDGGFDRLSEKESEILKNLPKEQQQAYIDLKKQKSENNTSQAVAELTKIKDEKKIKFETSFSPEDYELYSLNESDRNSLVESGVVTKEKFDQLDAYANAKKTEMGLETTPDTLSKSKLDRKTPSYGFLLQSSSIGKLDEPAWSKEQVSPEYKSLIDNVNSVLPEGLPEVPATNAVAKLYAEFEKNKADNNWSELQAKKESKKLVGEAYKSQLTDNEKFIGTLSDNEIVAAYENGEVSDDEIKRLLSLDETLVALGMSATIGNKARGQLGYASLSSGSSSTKKASKFTMPTSNAANTQTQSTLKNLQSLLESATSKSTQQKQIGGKVALRKIKVKGA